jgi:hypothetical protein
VIAALNAQTSPGADWAEIVLPHVAPPLLSNRVRPFVGSALASLSLAVGHVYVECRLGAEDDQVDVIAGVRGNARTRLCRDRRSLPANAAAAVETSVVAFVRRWASHAADLNAVSALWFEYDLRPVSGSAGLSSPSVFVEHDWHDRALTARQRSASIRSIYRQLTGHELACEIVSRLELCYRFLPPKTSIPYVGIMLGRATRAVRICVLGLSGGTTAVYLRNIEWSGDSRTLRTGLEAVEAMRQEYRTALGLVHLDVEHQVAASVGMEVVFSRPGQVRGIVAERDLFESLVRAGRCCRAKQQALLRWPGYSVGRVSGEPWDSVFVRRINNIKVVIGSDAALTVKGYLCTTKTPRCELRGRGMPDHSLPGDGSANAGEPAP